MGFFSSTRAVFIGEIKDLSKSSRAKDGIFKSSLKQHGWLPFLGVFLFIHSLSNLLSRF